MKLKIVDLLPLGSIVYLNGSIAPIMIIGFCVSKPGVDNEIFDYLGCLWPMGVLDTSKNFIFNHSDIKKIALKGYSDKTEKKYKKILNDKVLKEEQIGD